MRGGGPNVGQRNARNYTACTLVWDEASHLARHDSTGNACAMNRPHRRFLCYQMTVWEMLGLPDPPCSFFGLVLIGDGHTIVLMHL